MHEILRVLAHWPATRRGATAERWTGGAGLSSAVVWRVALGDETFALRRWQDRMDAQRLQRIHDYQQRLAELGPPVIPRLELDDEGGTFWRDSGHLWELATWMPGMADYWSNPQPQRLEAAMQTLAAIHNAAEFQPALPWEELQRRSPSLQLIGLGVHGSFSIETRAGRLQRIVDIELEQMRSRLAAIAQSEERDLGLEVCSLVRELAPAELAKAQHWRKIDLPMQRRLGDVHHDHILFTGDAVTGVIDFGAADYDSPAGDVARLLGSLVGDDRPRRQQGLAAYQSVHPLTPDEVAAVDFFDSSGTVIAAANWLIWLWPNQPLGRARVDREAGLRRLRQLLERLRALDDGGR